MTSSLIDKIDICDFRSIKGEIHLPLNAPVILIHGQNGTGKTSVLSAIELALTGGVDAMHLADENYLKHLIHHNTKNSNIGIEVRGEFGVRHEINISKSKITGEGYLDSDISRFFSERCYLAQATLGRLLDIYQKAEKNQESALSRFVNDLLGLDVLESLIEGLFPARNLRDIKKLIPEYDELALRIKKLESRDKEKQESLDQLRLVLERHYLQAKETISEFVLLNETYESFSFPAGVEEILILQEDEKNLQSWISQKLYIESLNARAHDLNGALGGEKEKIAATEEENALKAVEIWRLTVGQKLESMIDGYRSVFPELPSISATDPSTAYNAALSRVKNEGARCSLLVVTDEQDRLNLSQSQIAVENSKSKIMLIEHELENLGGEIDSLGNALGALTPHIHGEDCPVCGRNFSEVSTETLGSYVSTQIGSLKSQVNYMQNLAGQHALLGSEKSEAERQVALLTGRLLDHAVLEEYSSKIAYLADAEVKLEELGGSVGDGAARITRERIAQQNLAKIRSNNRLIAELRVSVTNLCSILSVSQISAEETILDAIHRLREYISANETNAQSLRILVQSGH